MKQHRNPYRINDPDDMFEVGENSSHPELEDAMRVWVFGSYTFRSATEMKKFFESEGLDPKQYWMAPFSETSIGGKRIIRIVVKPRWQLKQEEEARSRRFDSIYGT